MSDTLKWILGVLVTVAVLTVVVFVWPVPQLMLSKVPAAPAPTRDPLVVQQATALAAIQTQLAKAKEPVVNDIPIPQPTPEAKVTWQLPGPPEAAQLPTQLSPAIKYIEPPVNCAQANDPNATCSTIEGQVTDGDFGLKSGQAIVMTGDDIVISRDSVLLVGSPSLDTNHDLWVVVNVTVNEIRLHMYAPYGSFRGYFSPADGKWDVQKVTHLRNLHLYLFLLPYQTSDRFTPTPVPNCDSVYGCNKVNVRVVVYDDAGMKIAGYGIYLEGQPFWQDLLQFLGQ